MLALFLLGFSQHLERGVLEIEYSTQIKGNSPRPCFFKLQPNLVPKLFGIREEDSSFRPEYQQTREGFVFGMFFGVRPEHVGARLASEYVQPRVRNLVSKGYN